MYRKFKAEVVILQEGPTKLPRCGHCGMHMPEAWLERIRRTTRCKKVTEMQLRHRDVEMAEI